MTVDRLEISLGYERFGFAPHPRLSVLTGYWRYGSGLVAERLTEASARSLREAALQAPVENATPRPALLIGPTDLRAIDTEHADAASLGEALLPTTPLDRISRDLLVSFSRGAVLVLEDPFADLGTFDLLVALSSVASVSNQHQVLLLTEDPRQLGWAELLAEESEARLIPIDGLLDPRSLASGAPPALGARIETPIAVAA